MRFLSCPGWDNMSEIRIVGPGKTCGYPYPVCKKIYSLKISRCKLYCLLFNTLWINRGLLIIQSSKQAVTAEHKYDTKYFTLSLWPVTPLHSLQNYAPLQMSLLELCSLSNSLRFFLWNFEQISRLIRQCAEKKNCNSTYIFMELSHFVNFNMQIMSA